MKHTVGPSRTKRAPVSTRDRILRYLDKCAPSVAGAGGHAQTYTVACTLYNGFALTVDATLDYLRMYNERCQPPWSEQELEHKASQAAKATHTKPRGHFMDGKDADDDWQAFTKPTVKPKATPLTLNADMANKLPEPLPSPTIALLNAAFREGETVCIESAIYADRDLQQSLDDASTESSFLADCEADGVWPPARPSGRAMFKTREQWNKIFTKSPDSFAGGGLPGVFVVLNPFPAGTKQRTNDDVEQFRHVLLEFDTISKEAQWSVIRDSNVPCSAIIDSGGKSIHAWVRVDAGTREEYDKRARKLYDLFATYKPDTANVNPARLSRLAGARRHVAVQSLLAVDVGAKSFVDWAAGKGDGEHMQVHDHDALMNYVAENDPNNLVGRNWLKREGSLLLIGQSGIGKSSLVMQMAISFALGRPLFGIAPIGPLKVMVIQAENDFGDLAEQFQGTLAHLGIDEFSQEYEDVKLNTNLLTDYVHVAKDFVEAAELRITEWKPDIVIVDPLLSFIGDDISKQDVCSRFLRQWLTPVCKTHKFAWILAHHTNKPTRDKGAQGTTIAERAYAGAGSAELTNWARATMFIEETLTSDDTDERIFTLYASKRGSRTGMQALEGGESQQIWLKHDEGGRIAWIQRAKPESHELPSAKRKDAPAKYPVKVKAKTEPKKRGAPNKVQPDWIAAMILKDDDLFGSQRHMAEELEKLYVPINPEDKIPHGDTFIKALKDNFNQCEKTKKWTRK